MGKEQEEINNDKEGRESWSDVRSGVVEERDKETDRFLKEDGNVDWEKFNKEKGHEKRLEDNLGKWGVVSYSESLKKLERGDYEITTTPTGFPILDGFLKGGLANGQLCVLAGRPGTGKSSIALKWSVNMSQKDPVMVVTADMSVPETTTKVQKMAGNISPEKLKVYFLDRVTKPKKICSVIKELFQQGKEFGLVVIDHIQVTKDGGDSRTMDIEDAMLCYRGLAKDLNRPVLILSQLNRDAARDGRAPQLIDLKWSGALEESAHVVMALHEEKGAANLLLLKNRHGVKNKQIKLSFDADAETFTEVEAEAVDVGGDPNESLKKTIMDFASQQSKAFDIEDLPENVRDIDKGKLGRLLKELKLKSEYKRWEKGKKQKTKYWLEGTITGEQENLLQ